MFALQSCHCWRAVAWGATFSIVNFSQITRTRSIRSFRMLCNVALGGYMRVSLYLLGDDAGAAMRDAGNWTAAVAAIAFVYEAVRALSAKFGRPQRSLVEAGLMISFGAAISAHPAGFCCLFTFAVLGANAWSDQLAQITGPASGVMLISSTLGMLTLHLGCITVALCSAETSPMVASVATVAFLLTVRLRPEIAGDRSPFSSGMLFCSARATALSVVLFILASPSVTPRLDAALEFLGLCCAVLALSALTEPAPSPYTPPRSPLAIALAYLLAHAALAASSGHLASRSLNLRVSLGPLAAGLHGLVMVYNAVAARRRATAGGGASASLRQLARIGVTMLSCGLIVAAPALQNPSLFAVELACIVYTFASALATPAARDAVTCVCVIGCCVACVVTSTVVPGQSTLLLLVGVFGIFSAVMIMAFELFPRSVTFPFVLVTLGVTFVWVGTNIEKGTFDHLLEAELLIPVTASLNAAHDPLELPSAREAVVAAMGDLAARAAGVHASLGLR